MTDVLTILFGLGVMIFGTWLLIFGAGGAFLARSYGSSTAVGAILGCALGPFGWAITWWTNREDSELAQTKKIDPEGRQQLYPPSEQDQ